MPRRGDQGAWTGAISFLLSRQEPRCSARPPRVPNAASNQVLVHVLMDEEGWRIANVVYDNGKSLVDHYRQTASR